ncbi:hypothetical protein AB9K41_27840, partial [Cribrihabitans sp. XS_ASV171]
DREALLLKRSLAKLGTAIRAAWVPILVLSVVLNLMLGVLGFILQPLWRAAAVATATAATKAQAEIAEKHAVSREKAKAKVSQSRAVAEATSKAKLQAKAERAAAVSNALASARARAELDRRKAVAEATAKVRLEAKAQRATAVSTAVAAAMAQAEIEKQRAVGTARAKEKAKGRVRRVTVSVPVFGLAAAAGFEYWDYSQWLEDHPDGNLKQYSEETLRLSKEVADEVYSELPEALKPDTDQMLASYQSVINSMSAIQSGRWLPWSD